MLEWERTLESLKRQGWFYGFGKSWDTATGDEIYLVDLRRGDKRFFILKGTMEEAVTTISRLAQEES